MGLSLVRILRKTLLRKGGAPEKWALWFCKEYASDKWFTWYIAAIYELTGDNACTYHDHEDCIICLMGRFEIYSTIVSNVRAQQQLHG